MHPPDLPYRDRRDAGQRLATALEFLRGAPGLLILGLPRGGVPVAAEIARALGAPLDVLVVRKLGYPGHAEYAMGAIGPGGVRVLRPMPGVQVPDEDVAVVVLREQEELARREQLYRAGRPAPALAGRTVVLVDDGLATGSTLEAAILAARNGEPQRLCVAVPVGARSSCDHLRPLVDDLVCPAMPEPFNAVSVFYREFPQTSDEEVQELLRELGASATLSAPLPAGAGPRSTPR
jgi:putative phosphoribosyl transferase